jgi:hypothetical protein
LAVNTLTGIWATVASYLSASTTHTGFRTAETERGYTGLFRDHIKRRDSVSILEGSSVPIVLRQIANTNHYIHLGTCFVSRLMNGEAAGLVGEGKVCIKSVDIQ